MSYDVTYMGNLKNDTNELIHKAETDSQRMNLWLWWGRGGGGEKIDWEFENDMYTLLHLK